MPELLGQLLNKAHVEQRKGLQEDCLGTITGIWHATCTELGEAKDEVPCGEAMEIPPDCGLGNTQVLRELPDRNMSELVDMIHCCFTPLLDC